MTRTLLALALMALPASAETLKGPVTHVRDADTIEVNGVPVRLQGVDAAEADTPFGAFAKSAVEVIFLGVPLTCDLTGEKSYDREVGVCYLGREDIGAVIIASGLALDCARYSGGRYRHLETAEARARQARAGYC